MAALDEKERAVLTTINGILAREDENAITKLFGIAINVYWQYDESTFTAQNRRKIKKKVEAELSGTENIFNVMNFVVENIKGETDEAAKLARALVLTDWFWQKYNMPSVRDFKTQEGQTAQGETIWAVDGQAWETANNKHLVEMSNLQAKVVRMRLPPDAPPVFTADDDITYFSWTWRPRPSSSRRPRASWRWTSRPSRPLC